MTAALSAPVRLPLWRTVTGFGVLGILIVVLLALGPVYLVNYRLGVRLKAVASSAANLSEDALREKLLAEASALNLSLRPGDVRITPAPSQRDVQINYVVHRDLILYPVDLHFHPSAKTALPPAAAASPR